MSPNSRHSKHTLIVMLILILPILIAGAHLAHADQNQPIIRSQAAQLDVGDYLVVQSDHFSIQQVVVQGNLSVANMTQHTQYPTNNFQITAGAPGYYQITILLNQATSYNVNVFVKTSLPGTTDNSTTYYMSGGQLELDLVANFNPRPSLQAAPISPISPFDSFTGWVGSFSQAFPGWVKLLYLILGIQFFTVGGLWIRRETKRKESTAQRLDRGDRAYLWFDVAYKFLLTSFIAIVAIMGGELVLLFVLRFMFLVSIDLLSLWDLFVVGFAAGAVIITYMIRFALERGFDLKPVGDE
ncbi:MAG TPA: hypothetical protein VLV18_01815 [Terriglobales bacterium]|nr:hypothetical protein [Terriglobales bacterium]